MAQDFSGQNLRGRSFRGRQDLAGADFSHADIRGTDFTNVNLSGANFSQAQAGLPSHWVISLVILALLLTALAGYTGSLSGIWAKYFLEAIQHNAISSGVIVFIIFNLAIVFSFVTIHQGWEAALGAVAMVLAVMGAAAGFGAGAVVRVGFGVLAGAALGVLSATVGGAIGWTNGWSSMSALSWTAAIIWALFGFGDALYWGANWVLALAWAASEVVIIACLCTYFGWQMLVRNQTFALVEQIVFLVIYTGGTSFRGANLTDANFQKAMLKGTDFRRADLTRTCWFQAQKLERALIKTTYLEHPQIRQLVITKVGQDKNFDNLILRGVNLCGANLTDASLMGVDLSESNLQDANLSRAKLKQTQLDRTDLTGATLTGACIEDWGITSETKLHGVECDYVFMRLPTKDEPNPRRKPDNWAETFKSDDFNDFIAPLVKTLLDLYHNQQTNPCAVQLAFNQLVENNPEAELSVISIEARGKNNDKFLIKAKVAQDANTSELSAEYFANYNQYQALSPEVLRSLLSEKDKTILMLTEQVDNVLKTAISRPSIYAQTYENRGNTMSESKGSEINISGVTGSNISGIAGGQRSSVAGGDMSGVAGGDISGTVTTTISQLQSTNTPEAPKLAELLKQLQAAIEADANLNAEDKAEALEQVKALAEAGQNPKQGAMQKTAKSAMRMLKGLIADLPAVAKLVEVGKEILPAIAQSFGL